MTVASWTVTGIRPSDQEGPVRQAEGQVRSAGPSLRHQQRPLGRLPLRRRRRRMLLEMEVYRRRRRSTDKQTASLRRNGDSRCHDRGRSLSRARLVRAHPVRTMSKTLTSYSNIPDYAPRQCPVASPASATVCVNGQVTTQVMKATRRERIAGRVNSCLVGRSS